MIDPKKAESELLSLINSTFSHELRNPLNSIINQCKILVAYCSIMTETLLG
jgi:signal transduction histidine kinase